MRKSQLNPMFRLILFFYEAYRNEKDAKRREEYFKTTKGKTTLKLMLKEHFKNLTSTSSFEKPSFIYHDMQILQKATELKHH